MKKTVKEVFSNVEDPRVTGRCLHKLCDILFIAICTLLSNGEDFEDMVEFAEQRIEWLRTILELRNGIPSHDTFNRVLQIVDPEQLGTCLREDGEGLLGEVRGRLVNFDGKKVRGESPRSRGNKGLYILSAWVGESRLCIGQKKVRDKSNEITAIPELMDELDLEGSVVSVDAIGCQTEVADKAVEKNADFLLAVKQNQPSLFEEVSEAFSYSPEEGFSEDWEYDHGRFETRSCWILDAEGVLSPDVRKKWPAVRTIAKIRSERHIKGATSSETRYYISSEGGRQAKYYNRLVRGHWGIENHLHWHLDVTFREDENRSRSGNAPLNLNILRKMALHRLSRKKDRLSLKKRRYRASMNTDYLEKILNL